MTDSFDSVAWEARIRASKLVDGDQVLMPSFIEALGALEIGDIIDLPTLLNGQVTIYKDFLEQFPSLKKYPKEFVERKKIGFDFPLNDWIGDEHVDYLRQKPELIDIDALDAALQRHKGSHVRNRIIFSLVAFVAWHDG